MKNTLVIAGLLIALLPGAARADSLSFSEAYRFYYGLPLVWQQGTLRATGIEQIETAGEIPSTGSWRAVVLNSRGQVLRETPFEPSALAAADGTFTLALLYEPSGASIRIDAPRGPSPVSFDVIDRRMCNDNGSCEADRGEIPDNCPTDCGQPVPAVTAPQEAAVGTTVDWAGALGGIAVAASSAVAGVALLLGIVRFLDRRKRI